LNISSRISFNFGDTFHAFDSSEDEIEALSFFLNLWKKVSSIEVEIKLG
jgi:hypothetical protein